MHEGSRIEGLQVLVPRTTHQGNGCAVAEMRWSDPTSGRKRLALGYERTLTARAGFLCEPHFDASREGWRTLRCTRGEAFVVVVDVRRGSPTFARWQAFELSANDVANDAANGVRWIRMPTSLACGFLVTSDWAAIEQRLSHDPTKHWQWLDWRDPQLQVAWPEAAFTFASHAGPARALHQIPAEQLPLFTPGADTISRQHRRPGGERRSTGKCRPVNADSRPVVLSATVEKKTKLCSPSAEVSDLAPAAATPLTLYDGPTGRPRRRARHQERILVLGCRGQLGAALISHMRVLGNVIGACRAPIPQTGHSTVEVDVARPASLRQAIRDARPTLIINASAMTDIEACEANPRAAQLINATAPMLVAEEAQRMNIPVVHFCTSLVYGGRQAQPWRENDLLDPVCHYARTKAIGTEAVRGSNAPHLVLRTGWLYSCHAANFVSSLVDQALRSDCVLASADQHGTPTAANWLAAVTARLLSQSNGSLADWLDVNGGLLHATPSGFASRVDVAEHVLSISRSLGLPVSATSVRTLAPGPDDRFEDSTYNCRLDCARLESLLGEPLPRWQSQLAQHLTEHLGARHGGRPSTPFQSTSERKSVSRLPAA